MVANAQAGFGAYQHDLACVHAAQGGYVQGECGLVACALGRITGLGLCGRSSGVMHVHPVDAAHHIQSPGPDGGVELHRAGEDVGVARAACVQALPLYRDLPAMHQVGVQAAGFATRGTGSTCACCTS